MRGEGGRTTGQDLGHACAVKGEIRKTAISMALL
jgi:hypothetical protein